MEQEQSQQGKIQNVYFRPDKTPNDANDISKKKTLTLNHDGMVSNRNYLDTN